ncbi:type II toxin-antitoxin system CcdA family antitoxin [Pelagerythrobacter marensis]|uniref:type II toxin-antitoxin system CcdA family antitoxin n=1 Tax=Pelagerythrobacter marensis TaxID=543877 RepID=UPI0030843A38
MNAPSNAARKATNVSLDASFVAEAKALGINISQACERGLIETVKEARSALWQEENREAIESSNVWVEKKRVAARQTSALLAWHSSMCMRTGRDAASCSIARQTC